MTRRQLVSVGIVVVVLALWGEHWRRVAGQRLRMLECVGAVVTLMSVPGPFPHECAGVDDVELWLAPPEGR